jgi:hypothetical protein
MTAGLFGYPVLSTTLVKVPMFVADACEHNTHRMNVPNLPQWDFWPLVAGLVGISFLLLIVFLALWWFAFRNKTKAKEQNRKIKVRATCPPTVSSYSLLTPHTHHRTRTMHQTEGPFETAAQGLRAGAQEHGVEQPQSIFDGHPAIGRPPPHLYRLSTVQHTTPPHTHIAHHTRSSLSRAYSRKQGRPSIPS